MPNPLFSNRTSPNGSTSPHNALNDSNKRYKRGYNRFNLGRPFYNTERYADINVIEAIEGVEGDKITIGNNHEIRSYTLKSPIQFDIYKKKTYFLVDNKAILPINWEKIYKQPNKGDDVNSQFVNCVATGFINFFRTIPQKVAVRNRLFDFSDQDYLNYLFRVLLLAESVFSNGSLLASMNCHLSSVISSTNKKSFDSNLQSCFENLPMFFVIFPQLSDKPFTYVTSYPNDSIIVSKRQLLDMMRTYPDFEILNLSSNDLFPNVPNWFETVSNYFIEFFRESFIISDSDYLEEDYFNLSRLVAYQLIACQFYTNDSVDNVYTQELFMQNFKSIASKGLMFDSWPTFTYNGVKTEFDVFSGNIINKVLNYFLYDDLDVTNYKYLYFYLHGLFFFRKSLRYGDYFVGAKTLPFAPGDVTADVVNNGVSALDITRKILMQRFLNSVERARNTWKDYLRDVTDGVAAPKDTEPRFLASSTSNVKGFEVENTAERQGDIVTVLKSGNSNYVYEVEIGSPCIIIGVSTYEIQRVYSRTVDRFFKHVDRFDMFNKFMQNIGDQVISLGERNARFNFKRIFGYTPRHMEYKQRYPIASGGYIEYLPGYAFITDNDDSGVNDDDFNYDGLFISSSYIRNKNSEMDRYYSSLNGLTLSSYFHFQCKYQSIINAARQMEYHPTIL